MKKSSINLILDAIMFLMMALIAGIGLLLKYVLVSGSERWLRYGKNVDLRFLNLDRHQWGDIHLIIGIILIILLVIHVILHWKMISCFFHNMIKGTTTRRLTSGCIAIFSILLLIFPFIINIQIDELASGRERYQKSINHSILISMKSGDL